MQTSFFWHQFDLPWKKVVLLFLSIFLFFPALSQITKPGSFGRPGKNSKNLPEYDSKLIHYGFFMGLNYSRMYLKRSQNFANDLQRLEINPNNNNNVFLKEIVPKTNPGFSLGFVFNLNLNDNFAFRLLPSVGFYERGIQYKFSNDSSVYKAIQSTFVEGSFLMKYRSARRDNHRFYVVGGVQPGIEASAKKKEKSDDALRTNAIDLSIEYGFGMDIYFPLFKFSPELRFSHGILNMVKKDGNVFSRPIEGITTHTVTLLILFE